MPSFVKKRQNRGRKSATLKGFCLGYCLNLTKNNSEYRDPLFLQFMELYVSP